MIPRHILPRLSPTAVKIYMILLANANQKQHPATVTISLDALARLACLSRRTCAYAVRQLRALRLLQSFRGGENAPSTYRLLHASAPPKVHPFAPPCNPMHQAKVQQIALPPDTPLNPASKTTIVQSPALLLQNLLDPRHPLACDDPETLAALFNQLTDAEKQAIIAQAHATLASTPAGSPP